jgi:hypothetical protein
VISNNGSSSVSAARIEPMPTALGAGVTSTEHFPGAAVTVFPPKRHRRAGPAGFPLHARLSHKLVRKPVRQLIVRQHCSERLAEGRLMWDEAIETSQIGRLRPAVAGATS